MKRICTIHNVDNHKINQDKIIFKKLVQLSILFLLQERQIEVEVVDIRRKQMLLVHAAGPTIISANAHQISIQIQANERSREVFQLRVVRRHGQILRREMLSGKVERLLRDHAKR